MKNTILILFIGIHLGSSSYVDTKSLIPRIVGGENATIEDYPYQVSVLNSGMHACGGSIIHEKFVLTAGRCTYKEPEERITVRVNSSIFNSGDTIITVAKIHNHDDFNWDILDNDIAILELNTTLDFGIGVQKIGIPDNTSELNDDDLGTATGWGRISKDGPLSKQLQVVTIPIITTNDCKKVYSDDIFTDNMFCAGNSTDGHQDICTGDYGGPLIVEDTQVGISSWGGCGDASAPGVYTKLSLYVNFINNIINS